MNFLKLDTHSPRTPTHTPHTTPTHYPIQPHSPDKWWQDGGMEMEVMDMMEG